MVLGLQHPPQVFDLEIGRDLGQAQPDVLAQALDEPQALQVILVVATIGARPPLGRPQQPVLLVVADRPLGEFGELSDVADAQLVVFHGSTDYKLF